MYASSILVGLLAHFVITMVGHFSWVTHRLCPTNVFIEVQTTDVGRTLLAHFVITMVGHFPWATHRQCPTNVFIAVQTTYVGRTVPMSD